MDPRTIQEARRLLHSLIFLGEATFSNGTVLAPKPEYLLGVIEKVASKRVEEPEVPVLVDDFKPQETYRAISKGETTPPGA